MAGGACDIPTNDYLSAEDGAIADIQAGRHRQLESAAGCGPAASAADTLKGCGKE